MRYESDAQPEAPRIRHLYLHVRYPHRRPPMAASNVASVTVPATLANPSAITDLTAKLNP